MVSFLFVLLKDRKGTSGLEICFFCFSFVKKGDTFSKSYLELGFEKMYAAFRSCSKVLCSAKLSNFFMEVECVLGVALLKNVTLFSAKFLGSKWLCQSGDHFEKLKNWGFCYSFLKNREFLEVGTYFENFEIFRKKNF